MEGALRRFATEINQSIYQFLSCSIPGFSWKLPDAVIDRASRKRQSSFKKFVGFIFSPKQIYQSAKVVSRHRLSSLSIFLSYIVRNTIFMSPYSRALSRFTCIISTLWRTALGIPGCWIDRNNMEEQFSQHSCASMPSSLQSGNCNLNIFGIFMITSTSRKNGCTKLSINLKACPDLLNEWRWQVHPVACPFYTKLGTKNLLWSPVTEYKIQTLLSGNVPER